jgi:hypothetical protein
LNYKFCWTPNIWDFVILFMWFSIFKNLVICLFVLLPVLIWFLFYVFFFNFYLILKFSLVFLLFVICLFTFFVCMCPKIYIFVCVFYKNVCICFFFKCVCTFCSITIILFFLFLKNIFSYINCISFFPLYCTCINSLPNEWTKWSEWIFSIIFNL